jgi:regulator of sirC expression with transglutaminase-like and TPR domain
MTRGFLLIIYRMRGPVILFLLSLFLTESYAQKTAEINSGMNGNEQISGRIFFPQGDKSGVRPMVKLQSLSSSEVTGMADPVGNFRFTHLRPDTYTVIVDAGDAYEKAIETVTVGFSGGVPAQGDPGSYAVPLVYEAQFYLKYKHGAAPVTISPDVPAAAQDLFRQAVEMARAGDHEKAIEQLKSAIAHAPKFATAYNELAAEYIKTGRGDQALAILKEAVKTNPDDLSLRLSYGIALLNQKKLAAAEAQLLQLANIKDNPDAPTAGYYLGLTLMSENKTEAAQSVFETVIKNGGDKFAMAHKYLGGIYWRNKKYRAAADELEKYLRLEPKAADAAKVRDTVKELRQKG